MLLRQNLCRRHERSLEPGFDCEQDRCDCHDGFSRADVALQQAVHRMLRGKIAPDFCDHSVLRIGELKWKRAKKFLEQFAAPAMRCAGSNRRLSAPRRD